MGLVSIMSCVFCCYQLPDWVPLVNITSVPFQISFPAANKLKSNSESKQNKQWKKNKQNRICLKILLIFFFFSPLTVLACSAQNNTTTWQGSLPSQKSLPLLLMAIFAKLQNGFTHLSWLVSSKLQKVYCQPINDNLPVELCKQLCTYYTKGATAGRQEAFLRQEFKEEGAEAFLHHFQ